MTRSSFRVLVAGCTLLGGCGASNEAPGSFSAEGGGSDAPDAGSIGSDATSDRAESGSPDAGSLPPTLPQPVFTCGAATASTSAPPSGTAPIEGDILSTGGDAGDRIFANGSSFVLSVTTRSTAADQVQWQVVDHAGAVIVHGQFAVPASAQVTTIRCTSTKAGYFALSAQLRASGASLPQLGSRPAGIATFGVLPDLSPVLSPATFPHSEDHRFGIQGTSSIAGGDGFDPLYAHLGVTWVNDPRDWATLEPDSSGQYDPTTYAAKANPPPSVYAHDGLLRYVTMNGIPKWQNSNAPGTTATNNYPPISFDSYKAFVTKVGQEQAADRAMFPAQAKNYYQITWEPDPGPGTQWLGSSQDFVTLYKNAYDGIHAGDPNAVVLGPTDSEAGDVASTNSNEPISLANPAYASLAQYLDGLSIHGYYNSARPEKPPEGSSLVSDLRAVRHVMATQLRPHAMLISSESGISYDSAYAANYPSSTYLFEHGVDVAKSHVMLLGEGVDVTFLFYSADFSAEYGWGLAFNLVMPTPDYGSPQLSPKPAAMMAAAMTRVLDGTVTLGPLKGLPSNAYGYAFQRTGGPIVTCLWAHGANYDGNVAYELAVAPAGRAGKVALVDGVGNATLADYADGKVSLTLTDLPTYVVSADLPTIQAQVTTPEGYSPLP